MQEQNKWIFIFRFCWLKAKLLFKDSAFFAVLSLIIFVPFNWFGDVYTSEISAIFSENLAPHSLTLMVVVATSVSLLVFLIVGKYDENKRANRILYNYVVFTGVRAGKAYASTMLGMLTGLALASWIFHGFRSASIPLYFMFYNLLFWSIFEFIHSLAMKGASKKHNKKALNRILIFMMISLPALYIYLIYSQNS